MGAVTTASRRLFHPGLERGNKVCCRYRVLWKYMSNVCRYSVLADENSRVYLLRK